MPNVYDSTQPVVSKSNYRGKSIAAFPDVCTTPTMPGQAPGPIPYPAAPNNPQGLGPIPDPGGLRGLLLQLHTQLVTLPGGNPNRWHQTLDQYVSAAADLYLALNGATSGVPKVPGTGPLAAGMTLPSQSGNEPGTLKQVASMGTQANTGFVVTGAAVTQIKK